MSLAGQYTILSFLWNNSEGHDKVWGYFKLSSDPHTYYNFWGARGKKLTWKEHKDGSVRRTTAGVSRSHTARALIKLEDLARAKIRKGYQEVVISQIERVTPGFTDEFERNFTLARLFDNFHNKVQEEDS
jgi:hypothetical protein